MNLSEAKIGTYIVKNINGSGTIQRRFLDMGIIKGVRLELLKITRGRTTFLIKVRGFSLALRDDSACIIEIT